MKKQQVSKEQKKKNKEHKVIEKFVKKRDKMKQKYITKNVLKRKFKNAQTFTNADFVDNDGIIKLRDNTYARVFSVDAIDLSLILVLRQNNPITTITYNKCNDNSICTAMGDNLGDAIAKYTF